MNYYLAGEEKKKSQLVKLLNKFAKDKAVATLAREINKILETPVQKRLIPTIRYATCNTYFWIPITFETLWLT